MKYDSEMIVWRRVVIVFLFVFVAALIYFSDVLSSFFVAFGLAYAFNPVAIALQRKGLSRTAASALLTVLLVLLGALLITLIVPALIRDGAQFFRDFPDFAARAIDRLSNIAEGWGIDTSQQESLIARARQQLQKSIPVVAGSVGAVAQRIFLGAGAVVFSVLEFLIVPILLFFLLRSFPRFYKDVLHLIPPRNQDVAAERMHKIDRVCAGFIRGQLTVAVTLACIFAIGLPLLGVRYGLVIGILAGLLNMIPYIGQLTGVVLSLIMILVDFPGWGRVIAVPIFFGAVNFIEGQFLTPKIVGNKVGLSPLQAILALLVGAKVGGVAGMILALPAAGTFKVLFLDLLDNYRNSEFYRSKHPSAN
jgi:predicted PurR-regulated permease PerM